MEKTGRTLSWSVWIGLFLIGATLTAALMLAKLKSQLGAQSPNLPIIGAVPAFTLTNQHAAALSRNDEAVGHLRSILLGAFTKHRRILITAEARWPRARTKRSPPCGSSR